jgi:hypothetical protein
VADTCNILLTPVTQQLLLAVPCYILFISVTQQLLLEVPRCISLITVTQQLILAVPCNILLTPVTQQLLLEVYRYIITPVTVIFYSHPSPNDCLRVFGIRVGKNWIVLMNFCRHATRMRWVCVGSGYGRFK